MIKGREESELKGRKKREEDERVDLKGEEKR